MDDLEEGLGVEIDLYGRGEIMPETQVIGALQDGTMEMAIGLMTEWGGITDLAGLDPGTGFCWNSSMEQLTLFERYGLREIYAKSYEDLGGIKWLAMMPCDPLHLVTTEPVEKYEDLSGLVLYAVGDVAPAFEGSGATCIHVAWEEVYLSLATGLIDGIVNSGATECYTNGWHEVAPYFLTNPFMGAGMLQLLINKDLYDSLPVTTQKMLSMAVKDFTIQSMTYYYQGEAEHHDAFILTTMPDEDFAKLRNAAMAYWDELAQQNPTAAEVIGILRGYNELVEAAKWYR